LHGVCEGGEGEEDDAGYGEREGGVVALQEVRAVAVRRGDLRR
jgi:hypothetical protein